MSNEPAAPPATAAAPASLSADPHDRALVEAVHPPDWVNPRPAGRYHLVVIGAGTAGLVTAAGAAGLGARVALVERHLMGGDCLNVGCVPSKGVIAAARAWHGARHAIELGGPPVAGDGDFAAAMERMRRLRARIAPHDGAARFRDLGVDVFLGEGRFVSDREVAVGDARLRFRRAVIATGGRAAAPPIAGLDAVDYLTNETVFALTGLPARFGVVGAGPVGCEMAQAFARLGSRVSVFEAKGQVLPREDADAAALLQESMRRDGVDLRLGVEVTSVARRGDDIVVSHRRDGDTDEVAVDELLVAVGRTPNVESLGLDVAGVAYERGGVLVDDRLRTTNARIYACGDVASAHKFTHTADAQARIVIRNALFFGRARSSELVIPWCTYTSPEIAHVGLNADDATDAGIDVDTLTVPMERVDRALLDGEEAGFLRLHVKRGSDRIVGATLVAAHAGDIIGELSLAMTAGIGLERIAATIHPYPTQAEIIKKAADEWRRGKLTPTVRRLFALWFRLFS
jgi:pyruvate/2-oxoglutarate dehydrogenase complex dihydrolipoamide dehydrogenase (E3) component